jgi:hypothetical protein
MTIVEPDDWIVTRCRVRLAGRVTDAGGDVVTSGVLSLTAVTEAGRQKGTSSPAGVQRRFDARIRPDGFYFFLDLPAGDYVLDGRDQRGNEIAAKRISIPPAAGLGPSDIVGVDLSVAKSGADAPQSGALPLEAPAPASPAKRRTRARSTPAGDHQG